MKEDNWSCPHCGASDPHDAMLFPQIDGYDFDPELEVDVTCQSVYITPVDGGDGVAFSHDEFAKIIDHFESSEHTDTP